jgi:hypothetical protein
MRQNLTEHRIYRRPNVRCAVSRPNAPRYPNFEIMRGQVTPTGDEARLWNEMENETAPPEGLQVVENVVARDGIEPPTPAFSGPPTE